MITYPFSKEPKNNVFSKGGIENGLIIKNNIENENFLIEYDLQVLKEQFPFLKDKSKEEIYAFISKINQSIVRLSSFLIPNK